MKQEKQTCALCESRVQRTGYLDGDKTFCCTGCQAVYQILSCQQVVSGFTEHPLFRQALKSGLISNPDLIEEIRQRQAALPEEEFKKLHLEVQEMWCPSCAQVISLILMREKGVRSCQVDYSTDLASIEYAPRFISKEKIFKLIEQLGYRPLALQDPRQKPVSTALYLRFIVAAFFSTNIMMFAYPIYASYFHAEGEQYATLFSWLSLVCTVPVLTYSAWPIWRRCYTGLQVGIWGMELLVMMGVFAAFGLSLYELWRDSHYVYFDSLTVIIAFVLLGKIIESKAKFSAKDSLLTLTRGLPRRGRKRFADGSSQFVPLKDIQPGDQILVLAGEKIVLDGIVKEGEGTCDESLMTGEALPVFKKEDSSVLAGALLQQGRLCLTVTAKPEETALHRIITMVEQDLSHKASNLRAIDQIVRGFIPLVIMLAFGTAIYCLWNGIVDPGYTVTQTAVIRAISILLISCPCAIGIAAPLAESHVLNALAKMGAIVRNRGCLAFLGKETVFIFDKTGTITEGKFTVLSGLQDLSQDQCAILKEMVCYSNHPIAVAINQSLMCPGIRLEKIEEMIGKGIRGWKGQDSYLLGSASFLKEQGVLLPPFLLSDQTTVFFAQEQTCLTTIVLGDQVRQDAVETISTLAPLERWLVSGDSIPVVEAVAKTCHFDHWRAGCHPLQKKELVEDLKRQGKVVAMLGDGINDAPALTASHVGIAVVSATDLSIQVSDILLTTHHLKILPRLRQIARKGHAIVKQNVFWAFFYNVIGIGLAMGGLLSPLFAAFAMVTSSLIVLLNAQRIR